MNQLQDWKTITKQSYEHYANEYASFAKGYRGKLARWIEDFAGMFDKGDKILDMGCGHGRDAYFLVEKGLDVTGIDFSESLLKIAKEFVPEAKFVLMDFEELDFSINSFNGVWASASLVHLPKKRLLPVLRKIHSILKKHGIFFSLFRVGKGERFTEEKRGNATLRRFYSYSEPEELRKLFAKAIFFISNLENEEVDFIESGDWVAFFLRK